MGNKTLSLPTYKQIIQTFGVPLENANHLTGFLQAAKKCKIKVPATMAKAFQAYQREIVRVHKLVSANELMWNQVLEGTKNAGAPATKTASRRAPATTKAAGN